MFLGWEGLILGGEHGKGTDQTQEKGGRLSLQISTVQSATHMLQEVERPASDQILRV